MISRFYNPRSHERITIDLVAEDATSDTWHESRRLYVPDPPRQIPANLAVRCLLQSGQFHQIEETIS